MNKINYYKIFLAMFFFIVIFIFDAWLVWKFTSPFMVPLYHIIGVYSNDDIMIDYLNSKINFTIFNSSF